MDGCGVVFGVNFDRDAYLESRILASFDHGPTSQSNPTPVFEKNLNVTVEKARYRVVHYRCNSGQDYPQNRSGDLKSHEEAPLLATAARSGAPDPSFPLLGGSSRSDWSGGLCRHFRRDCIDLHGRENLLKPVEDFVTIDMLHQTFG